MLNLRPLIIISMIPKNPSDGISSIKGASGMARAFHSFFISTVVVCLAFFLASCDRESQSTSNLAMIKLDLPKNFNSVFTTGPQEVLMHVVINVTAPDLSAPLSVVWDANGGATAPDSFSLTVPQGSGRLIQVLAVYANPVSQALDFMYGDATQTLSGPSQSVSIGLAGLGAGPVTVGQVYGRYLTTATGGPTGNVRISFSPPGKPKMLIQRSLIANGWFSFFMLNGAPLEYTLDDGTLLWGTAVDLTNSLLSSSSKILRADIPVAYFREMNAGSPTWSLMNPQSYVYGWFTDPAMSPTMASSALSANFVCYSSTDAASGIPWLSPYSATPPGLSPTLLSGTSSGSAQTPLQLLNLTTPLTQYYLSGGTPSTSPCTTSSDQVTTLTFNSLKLSGHGNDSAGPFAFPFVDTGSSFGSVSAFTISPNTPANGTYILKALLLSGAETAFDQFFAYKVDSAGLGGGGSLSCGDIAGGALGFQMVGSSSVSGRSINFQIPMTTFEVENGTTVAVCGQGGGVMYDQPFFISSDKFNLSTELLGAVGAPDHIVVRPLPGALSSQTCEPFSLELRDSQNNLASNTVDQGIEFKLSSSNPTQVLFYDDASCSGAQISSVNFYAGQVSADFYVKSGTTVGTTSTLSLVTTNPLIPVASRSWSNSFVTAPATQGVFATVGSLGVSHAYDTCFRLMLLSYLGDQSSSDVTLSSSNASGNLTLAGVTGAVFYPTLSACNSSTGGSASSNLTFSSGRATTYVKVPAAGNPTSAYVTVNASISLTGYPSNYTMSMDRHFAISAPTFPSYFTFTESNAYPQPNECVDYVATLTDGAQNTVTSWSAPSVLPNIQIEDFSGGRFYDHCGGAPLASTPLFTLVAPQTTFSFAYESPTANVDFQAYAVYGNLRIFNNYSYGYAATADALTLPTPFHANANSTLVITGTGFDGSETVFVQTVSPVGVPIPCAVTGAITDTTITCQIMANQMVAGTLYQLTVTGEGQQAFQATPLQLTPN